MSAFSGVAVNFAFPVPSFVGAFFPDLFLLSNWRFFSIHLAYWLV
jgi:hypothetical protein